MAGEPRGIQAIEVGGSILSVLIGTGKPMMLRDIAVAANIAPAQCHAYLTSYRNIGLIEQDPQSGLYRFGPLAMHLAMGRMRSFPVLSAARQALRTLSEELAKVAMLVAWSPSGPTVVDFQNGSAPLTMNLKQGTLFSVTGTASGLSFAAFDRSAEVEAMVAREQSGISDRKFLGHVAQLSRFRQAVEDARKHGYAAVEGTPIPGVNAISAPIYDKNGQMILTITLFGRSENTNTAPGAPIVKALLATTSELSQLESEWVSESRV